MAKKKKQKLLRIKCTKCKRVNYYAWRGRGIKEYKKFCKWCRTQTLHKESK
ncbi:MAG: 50S ribosomal protein L33 [bacterium]